MNNADRFRKIDFTREEGELTKIDQETKLDSDRVARKRIDVSKMSAKEIQEKFHVSRTTAWRAKKRGWFFMNYHVRLIDMDPKWAEENVNAMRRSAKFGAKVALRMLGLSRNELKTISLEDLEAEGLKRLLELSGHPDRDNDSWRIAVAKNAAANLLRIQVINPDRYESEETEI